MKAVNYGPHMALERLTPMYASWNLPPVKLEQMPVTSFIVENIAGGSLYLTDAKIALIEGLIINREAPEHLKSAALDAVVNAIANKAKELGFTTLYGFTSLDAVVQRANRLGFKTVGKKQQLVVKEL